MRKAYLFLFMSLCLWAMPLPAQTDTSLLLGPGKSIHLTYHLVDTEKPLVVLQAGARSHADVWNALVPLLREAGYSYFTYDRPGLGASPSISGTREAAKIATELRQILKTLKMDREMILVGHSMGGVYQAIYHDVYPENIKGLIMIDSPDGQWEDGLRACLTTEQNASRDSSLKVMRAGLPAAVQAEYLGAPDSFEAMSGFRIQTSLVIVSGGAQNWPTAYDADCLNRAWQSVQQRMLSLGKEVRHLVSESSGHGIPYQDPEIIMQAIGLINQ